MVPEVGIAPTSPALQAGANLPQLLGVRLRAALRRDKNWLAESKLSERRLVVPAGNAPASSGYQPGALLLSYETSSSCGFTPKRRIERKVTVGFAAGRMRMTRFGL
jgi:hypothetical protein